MRRSSLASRVLALLAVVVVAASADCGNEGGGNGPGASVLQYQANAQRNGVIVDPAITLATAPNMHVDERFVSSIDGTVHAQPLFVDGLGTGKDMVLVATDKNQVYALDATTGTPLWTNTVGTPVPLGKLPCGGGIDPYGIIGTPIVDLASRRMFLDAMTTPDGGTTVQHLIFALSIDDGSVVPGWPVDANAAVTSAGVPFLSKYQGERGALAIMGGNVYVPFGGLAGDCGTYHGWVVEVQMSDATKVKAWATSGLGGGIWGPGGLASDGARVYGSTGNTIGVKAWAGGEAVVALPSGVAFSGAADDYWVASDWQLLDNADADLGGTGPIVFDLPGSTPSQLILAAGKDGYARVMDRNHLGGIVPPAAVVFAIDSSIIGGATLYSTDQGTFAAMRGDCLNGKGMLGAVSIAPGAPPTMAVAWCANQNGSGSPITTTSDGVHDAIVWAMGTSGAAGVKGDNRLHGFDGRTGAVVFDGGGPGDVMSEVSQWATPIAAKGRIFAAATGRVFAFTPK